MKRCITTGIFLIVYNLILAQNVVTVAGTGSSVYSGNGVPATAAGVPAPSGGTFDKSGNYYFVGATNRVRRIDVSGIITTVAGGGVGGHMDGVQATATSLSSPTAIKLDTSGNLYISEGGTGRNRIRKIDKLTGIITTIAGIGTGGFSGDGSPATAAMIWNPNDLCFDKWGNLYLADLSNFRIRKIDAAGIITTIAGCGGICPIGDGGPATNALLNVPRGITVDDSGNVYIADESTNRVRKVNKTTGIITTIAGNGTFTYIGDGMPATNAQINPIKLAFDTSGQLYIADDANSRVYKIDLTGTLRLVAGNGTTSFGGDGGPATAAAFNYPAGVSFDPCGNLYVPDVGNHRIRKITFNPTCNFASLNIDNHIEPGTISIYPNPANDELKLENIKQCGKYYLHNIICTVMQNGDLKVGTNTISIKLLPPGIYMLVITNENGDRIVRKICKQ